MDEIITYEQLKTRLKTIPIAEHRALLCTIYACMARVGEVVRGRYTKTKGIEVKDGMLEKDMLILTVRTEKTHTPRKIRLFKNRETWLIDIIVDWAKRKQEGELFPYSTGTATKIFKKYFPEFTSNRRGDVTASKHTIHWLRAWRYTHYRRGEITGKIVESKVASMMGGWVSSSVPERFYDFSKIDDYVEELRNS